MVNILDIDIEINKDIIFRNLKFVKNTESYKNADEIFDELSQLIRDNISLVCLYTIVDSMDDFQFEKINDVDMDKIEKIVLCFLSSSGKISCMVNNFINDGYYLKGYLLNEMVTHIIFNSANKMNKIIKNKLLDSGLILTKRYAPGDNGIDLKYQANILNIFKKHIDIDAHLTENYMIVPEKSLMYFFGAKKGHINYKCDSDYDEDCKGCNKLNCQYRKLKV